MASYLFYYYMYFNREEDSIVPNVDSVALEAKESLLAWKEKLFEHYSVREGGRKRGMEEGREGGKEEGREEGREGGREGGRKGGREGGREEGREEEEEEGGGMNCRKE